MKRICVNCSTEMDSKVRICPGCGRKNVYWAADNGPLYDEHSDYDYEIETIGEIIENTVLPDQVLEALYNG